MAELRPIPKDTTLEERLRELEERGVVSAAPLSRPELEPVARRPGALDRFLESRD